MHERRFSSPLIYFFLMFPSGISSGFLSVTLPFIFTRAGVPVATTAALVAIGNSPNVWRFLWGPLADFSLSTHTWYVIGIFGASATLLLVAIVPPHPGGVFTGLVFVSQMASVVTVAVDPNYRRRGIARSLVLKAIAEARDQGIKRVEAASWSFNEETHEVFRRLGFTPKTVRFEIALPA